MNKIGAISALVVTGGMLFVCANAHIDFFPCEIKERVDYTGPIQTKSGTCSLMYHLDEARDGESSRLTGGGWAMLLAFCGGIGVAAGFGIGKFAGNKKNTEA